MRYDEFMNLIEKSEIEDWIQAEPGQYISRHDLLVSIRENKAAGGSAYYDWAGNFDNPGGQRADWELCYNGVCIEKFETLKVDEGRMYIPLPDENLQISDRQRRIGYIVNTANRTDFLRYLDKARITVNEAYTIHEPEAGYAYTS